MDIIARVAEALEDILQRGIPVVNGWYDENINKTHVTFMELTDRTNNVSDDEEEDIAHVIQVDIWSKTDEWKLKSEIKKMMINNDFGYIEGADLFDIETKIYHKALRFDFLEEVI